MEHRALKVTRKKEVTSCPDMEQGCGQLLVLNQRLQLLYRAVVEQLIGIHLDAKGIGNLLFHSAIPR